MGCGGRDLGLAGKEGVETHTPTPRIKGVTAEIPHANLPISTPFDLDATSQASVTNFAPVGWSGPKLNLLEKLLQDFELFLTCYTKMFPLIFVSTAGHRKDV